jgi:acyl-CoA synthetase (AMP-forming)/AMP-acid ligase II
VQSLGEIVRLNGKRVANEIAVVWHDVRLTHKELDTRTNALANVLLGKGIKKGDRVALIAANCNQFIEVHAACSKIGAILVPLNTMLQAAEVSHLLNHSEPKAVFVTKKFAETVASIKGDLKTIVDYISIDGDEGFEDYETIVAAASTDDPGITVEDSEIAYITYTSGTTGLPKGVTLTHRNVIGNAVNAVTGYEIPLGGCEVIAFPMFFSAVFNSHVIAHLFAKGKVVVLDWFKPETFIEAINKEKPTFTLLNPTMLHDFVNHPEFKSCDLSCLRLFLVTAAAISAARFNEARAAIGDIFIQAYGLTECTSFTTCTRPADYDLDDEAALTKRLTSVGRVGPLLDLKVVDEEGNEVAYDGEAKGELAVKGASVMKGYWNMDEATKSAILDGWLHTGDLASMDEEGYVWITGRKKDMIISGGMNVYPEEVEDVLYRMPEMKEVAVVGRADERWGESVTAVVVLKEGASIDADGVVAYCKANMASFKKPTQVIFLDELPHNASGKIKKAEIRDSLAKGELV